MEYKKTKSNEDNLSGNDRKTHPSAKDYISCRNWLVDYEHDKCNGNLTSDYSRELNEEKLTLNDMNDDLFCDLMEYAYEPRPKFDGEYKYKTEGELVNKTLQKRFDCLFTFLKEQYGKVATSHLKKPKLKFIVSEIVRLDTDEIAELINTDVQEPHLQKTKDYFLFLCHTGLRFGDFLQLNSTYYNEETNKINLQSQKTFSDCEIFLMDIAKAIGKKYNFEFNSYTNQAFNRNLKELFEKYDLYSKPHTKTYYQKGRKTITNLKREFISSHTGRKTFISMLFENDFTIFAVMGMTGHKKVDTLKHYADKFGRKTDSLMEKLNNKLNNTYKNEL